MRIVTSLLVLALGAAPAFAGQAEAQSCAAGLDANGQMIFEAALPQAAPGADVKSVITDAAKSLVMSGKIKRADAKPAATAAGACLKLTQN